MTEAVSPRETMSSAERVAHSRGVMVGTFIHEMESSKLSFTPQKSEQLMEIVSGIALKPPSIRLNNQRYNDIFSSAMKQTIQELRENGSVDLENRAKFYERMIVFSSTDQLRIRIAYDLAKYSHRGMMREDGGRYFEHVRGAALILFDECGIRDPDMIIAALLHDSVEDATIFGSPKGKTTVDWMHEANLRLAYIFGPYVAEMVATVTKPKIDGEQILDRETVKKTYLKQIEAGSPEAILVKMADRLHNLRTLFYRPMEDQKKVARETLEDYLPIFGVGSIEYECSSNMLFEIKDLATQYLGDSETIYMKNGMINRTNRQTAAYPQQEDLF